MAKPEIVKAVAEEIKRQAPYGGYTSVSEIMPIVAYALDKGMSGPDIVALSGNATKFAEVARILRTTADAREQVTKAREKEVSGLEARREAGLSLTPEQTARLTPTETATPEAGGGTVIPSTPSGPATGLKGRLMKELGFSAEEADLALAETNGVANAYKLLAEAAKGNIGGGTGRTLFPEEAGLLQAQTEATRAKMILDREAETRAALDSEVTRKVSLENLAINLRKMGLEEQAAIVDQRAREVQLSIQNMQADIAAAGELRASRQGKAEAALGLGRLSLDTQRAQNEQALQMYNLDTQRQAQERDILSKPSDVLARLFFQRGGTSPTPFVSQADLINRLRSSQPKLSPIQMDEGLRSRLTAILDAPDPAFERKPVMLTPTAPAPAAAAPTPAAPPSSGFNQAANNSAIAAAAKSMGLSTPGFARGTPGTKAREFVVGDPQVAGEPNPERVTVHNPGKNTTVEVEPMGDVQQMRAKMAQFALGTDPMALYQILRAGGATEQAAADIINTAMRSDRALASNEAIQASLATQQPARSAPSRLSPEGSSTPAMATYETPMAVLPPREFPFPPRETDFGDAAPAVAGWSPTSSATPNLPAREFPFSPRGNDFGDEAPSVSSGANDSNQKAAELHRASLELQKAVDDMVIGHGYTRPQAVAYVTRAVLSGGRAGAQALRGAGFDMTYPALKEGVKQLGTRLSLPSGDRLLLPQWAESVRSLDPRDIENVLSSLAAKAKTPHYALGTGVTGYQSPGSATDPGNPYYLGGRARGTLQSIRDGILYDWEHPTDQQIADYGAQRLSRQNTATMTTPPTPEIPQVSQDEIIRTARQATTPAGAAFLSGGAMPELDLENLPLPSAQQLGAMTPDERLALEPRLAAEYNTTLAELIDMMQKRYGGTRQRATARLGVR